MRMKGQRFGKLKVVGPTKKNQRGWYECLCDCGASINIPNKALQDGRAMSCGCEPDDYISQRKGAGRKPGTPNPKRYSTQEVCLNKKICSYRFKAKENNRKWLLSKDDAYHLLLAPCFYCGLPPSGPVQYSGEQILTSGIDRLDPSQHYIKDNCVACCWKCNRAKADMTEYDFIDWVKKLCKHLRI